MRDLIKLSSPATGEFWEIQVLFEDADLLALNKPAGLMSAPDPLYPGRANLIQLLHEGIAEGKPWARNRGLSYLVNVHSPDSDSSGVVLLARSKPIMVKLADAFGSQQPLQRYIALAQGQAGEDRFFVDAKLAPDRLRPQIVRVDQRHGKRSRTLFEVRERFANWTLLKCGPIPGRPHQIRAHLRSIGLPVAGDQLYGGRPLLLSRLKDEYRLKPNQTERPLINRAALHLDELAFSHPASGAPLTIAAPWPKDLQVAIKYLRRYAPVRSPS